MYMWYFKISLSATPISYIIHKCTSYIFFKIHQMSLLIIFTFSFYWILYKFTYQSFDLFYKGKFKTYSENVTLIVSVWYQSLVMTWRAEIWYDKIVLSNKHFISVAQLGFITSNDLFANFYELLKIFKN